MCVGDCALPFDEERKQVDWTHVLLSTPVKDPQAVGTQTKGHVLVACLVTVGFLMLMNGILVAG